MHSSSVSNGKISKATLEQLIDHQNFQCSFQPIFDVHLSKPIGYEALMRAPVTMFNCSPIEFFDTALAYGLLAELELCCRRIAIKRFVELKLEGLLFLNASPLAIEQNKHKASRVPDILLEYGLAPERIVIEITERYEARNETLLKDGLKRYRDLGFKIAIDDLGTGHSGLKQWSEVRPDIVKIDRYFISDCANNIVKRELIRTIFELGKATGVAIIAEGIENEEEYLTLRKLGMKYAQGYLLGRPETAPNMSLPKLLAEQAIKRSANLPIEQFELTKLLLDVSPISGDESCKSVYTLFKSDSRIKTLAVIDENELPIGMVYRDELNDLLSTDYGHALYDKQPVVKVMKPVSLAVDIASDIDEVSKLITDNTEFDQHPEFIVTSQSRYIGLANVRSILKMMTEEKIMHAQQANPLTMLPGNVVIEQKIGQLIKQKQAFHLAYFDLDNFKPFNDVYGYAAGDQVIKLVADAIRECCVNQFVGHVGGDDFVVLFKSADGESLCQQAIDVFKQRIQHYFEPEHLAQKGYFAKDREGNFKLIPLLSISCGVIYPDLESVNSVHDVSVLATRAKKMAKEAEPNRVCLLKNDNEVVGLSDAFNKRSSCI